MNKIWWTWDLRMRWAWNFCEDADSFVKNYSRAIDAAVRYGVEAIVVWGFLRDRHGGIDAARRVCDYACARGVEIFPGVGIDAFGGAYCSGNSPWSLDRYLAAHPEAQARREDGSPSHNRWPPTDTEEHLIACPSDPSLMPFYRESLDWLVRMFDLRGLQLEQGDVGLCFCERCRGQPQTVAPKGAKAGLENIGRRLPDLIRVVLARKPEVAVIVENYSGFRPEDIRVVAPFLEPFPGDVYHSWQAYDAGGKFFITDQSRSPTPHGCMAVRTNNDYTGGELDDRENMRRAVAMARAAGLDMTYTYGEYPDDWPTTRGNYQAWAEEAGR